MIDHALVVLAGIVPGRRDNLLYALQHLVPEHFRVLEQRNLFQMLERYHDQAGDILAKHTLTDMLQRAGTDVAKTVLYEALYEEVHDKEVVQHEFRYAVEALKDLRAEQLTGEALTTALEVLDRGVEIERVERKGHRDAREYAYAELTRIDKMGSIEATPEGDMKHDSERMISLYADRKSGKTTSGLTVGIDAIDQGGGWSNGELILVTAYTGEGKSMLSTQSAWYTAVKHGKNVFFATSETVRDQVMRRLIARHSREPQFGRPEGIDSNQIKNGTLSDEDEKVMLAAWDDLKHNPTYGRIYLCQVPRGATLSYVEARMNRQAASFQIDLCVIDYIALLKAEIRRQKTQEEYNDMLKDAKVLATSHDQGRGVPLVSPWAMSQAAWKKAVGKDGPATGEYTLGSLAETSEAEKSADQICYLLRLLDQPNEAKFGHLKFRDGELPPSSTLEVDYRNAYLTDKRAASSADLFEGY